MKQTVAQYDVETVDTLKLEAVKGQASSRRTPSYRATPWKIVNQLLDLVDNLTGGRADWVQRFLIYSFIGGFAALINLAVFSLVLYGIKLPVDDKVQNLVASLIATEISLMANFIPNDFFTFRHLAGHQRTWGQRCVRYHLTSIVGSVLTYLIQFGFRYIAHVPAIVGQAIALILVLIYNFSFHHIFTYRHVEQAAH